MRAADHVGGAILEARRLSATLLENLTHRPEDQAGSKLASVLGAPRS